MLFPYQLLYLPVLSSFRGNSEQLSPKRLKAVELVVEKVYNNGMKCIFCEIIEKTKPAKVYFEDDDIIVFADILPRASIHLLICPRRHFRNLNDVTDDLLVKMLQAARTIAKRLSIEENFRLVLNNGARAGQIVEHIHFHFMSNAPGINIEYMDR
jgi:histidine triad (HIT) family protein